jgi:hypothetical protein
VERSLAVPHDSQHDSSGYLYMALGFSAIGLFVALAMVTRLVGPASIPIWGISLGGVALLMRGPVGQALGRRIGGPNPNDAAHLEVPPEVYAELDELRARMLEMEERQDFSERMLASRGESTSSGGDS